MGGIIIYFSERGKIIIWRCVSLVESASDVACCALTYVPDNSADVFRRFHRKRACSLNS